MYLNFFGVMNDFNKLSNKKENFQDNNNIN